VGVDKSVAMGLGDGDHIERTKIKNRLKNNI
jgi:hypothetical protein